MEPNPYEPPRIPAAVPEDHSPDPALGSQFIGRATVVFLIGIAVFLVFALLWLWFGPVVIE